MAHQLYPQLAGRVEIIYLNPLSEQEKHRSKYSLLQAMLERTLKPDIRATQKPINGFAEVAVQGGYPEPNTRSDARAQQWYKQYVTSLRDVADIATMNAISNCFAVPRSDFW